METKDREVMSASIFTDSHGLQWFVVVYDIYTELSPFNIVGQGPGECTDTCYVPDPLKDKEIIELIELLYK